MHALGKRAVPFCARFGCYVISTCLQYAQYLLLASVNSLSFLDYGMSRKFPTRLLSDFLNVDNGFSLLFWAMMIFQPTFGLFFSSVDS